MSQNDGGSGEGHGPVGAHGPAGAHGRQLERVLILNAGSSSLKWSVLRAADGMVEDEGNQSWQDPDPQRHEAEVQAVLGRAGRVDAAGHRVVHGGPTFQQAVLVDDGVRRAIADLADLAPLHNPAALAGIEAVAALDPALPQVAAFDTAFHRTIPERAALYAVPREWTARWSLRRYGFHGLSVSYAVGRSGELLGSVPARLVVCHLGSGCSITAVRDGRSADTSMGFTPLEGVMMGTRSGSVDPGLLLYLLTKQGVSAAELDDTLNDRSGLLGVSGVAGDLRKVQSAIDVGDAQAAQAYDMFVYSLARMAGAMIGVLGGLDALVFTGGIGEHSARVRGDVCQALGYAGVSLRPEERDAAPSHEGAQAPSGDGDRDIAAPDSRVRVLVLAAREDLSVLAEVRRLLG